MTTATLDEQVFRLPDLGEGLTDAEIVEWKVAVGDTVTIDQVVVEVETAKAAVEVPVPYAGTVLRLHAEAGTPLGVGEPLITVGAAAPAAPVPAVPDTAAERYREEEQAGSGNVLIGYGTGHEPAPRRRRRRTAAAPQAPAPAPVTQAHAPRVVSPLVRRLARDHGIDLAELAPSGPAGVVLRRDVEQAVARQAPASTEPAPAPASDGPVRIPLRGIRKAVADKLTRSRTEIPDATTWVDVDATGLLQAKRALEAAEPGRRIGLLALFARICVAGLRRYPELNSTVDTERREIVRFDEVHLGFAAQTDRGLVVPVVRDAHRLTTVQLAAELARLTELARTGSLPPDRLTGGTFTLNNYGVFGVDGSTPIINHPEAALLGVGRIVDKPWVVDGELTVRKVTQLSFSFDHRVCDGGTAGGFLRFVADCVERPAVLLADI
ncbi:branched-chain alpha-keto acid dehydrogenase subunit E2 [Streptomyces canus]|uniref:Dihydrolipoamide acetyltransferase component of pyruvate dehydrogenase complex n=1 Tax=Streptomyces canus TaxID=58343 RepID=A0A101SIA6_9ACTN|nr:MULTISPECIES: dihydrolipoamide acetyltransferase family protein [Streptomyces]KUN74455.1 branched-chain alpha-keto acid dehydrogenase subunit E2 [Streptomyces canus]MDI5912220.1 dihydrolipoamide acetyltransferase family protein [Streptomyces sp. 12257]